MRRTISSKLLWAFVLMAGLAVGNERRISDLLGTFDRREVNGLVSVADCSLEKDPDPYFLGLRSHLEEISALSDRVGGRFLATEPAVTIGERNAFINNIPSRGYIDEHIFSKMREDNIPHAPFSGDAAFLRRVTLDLTGRILPSEVIREFLMSDDPAKRSAIIDILLGTPEFVDKWTMFFGDLVRNTSRDSNVVRYPEGMLAFYEGIKEFVASGMPYDVFVTNLYTATGNTWENGYANWIVGARTPMGPIQDTYDTAVVRSTTQFLGMNSLDCLLCHSGAGHLDSLNVWATGVQRQEAWGMAAFFARTATRRSPRQDNNRYYYTISDARNGGYRLNTDDGNRTPRQPFGEVNVVAPRYMFSEQQEEGSTYREMFARNLVRDRQFARATVNYLWRELMGVGIVEPADQFDLARLDPDNVPEGWSLQPSHPQLLEALSDDFISSGFDIRHLLRQIANSSAYQLSSRFNGDWRVEYTAYFARKFPRRLWAEEVHDAVATATQISGGFRIRGMDEAIPWAMQLPEPLNVRGLGGQLLTSFLIGDRDLNPRSGEATILQAMNMLNNNFVVQRVRDRNQSTVARLLDREELSNAEIVDELFLNTLSRFPTVGEQKVSLQAMEGNRVRGAEDLQWALLNKVDFLYVQ